MKQSAFVAIGLLILSLALFACTPAFPESVAVAATPSASATIIPVETPTLTPTLPILPTSILETPTITPVPTARVINVPAGTLTRLIEVPFNDARFQLSPDTQWLSYITIPPPPPETSYGPGPSPAVLHLMSIESGAIWDVTSDCTTFVCEFAWLSTGQLLWRENGNLYVADTDGANRYALAAPEPMVEIFGVTPTDIVILRGETHLWRLYLPDGQWDQIPVPQMGPAPVLDYVNQNDRLYFNEDSTQGAVSFDIFNNEFPPNGYGTVILHIPFEKGSPPTYIMPPTPLAYLGTDGGPIPPPVPLANAPYWLINEPLSVSEDGFVPTVHFLVDGTGTLVPLAEVLNLTNYQIFNTTLSPDRRWINLIVAPQLPYPAPTEPSSPHFQLYVAPTDDLAEGQWIEGAIVGWRSTPSTLVIQSTGASTDAPYLFSPTDNTTTPLETLMLPLTTYHAQFSEMYLFVLGESTTPYVYAYTQNGTLVAASALPPPNENSFYSLLSTPNDSVYLLMKDYTSSVSSLWRWDVAP